MKSSLTITCAIVVTSWIIFVLGFSNYIRLSSQGPPKLNIGSLTSLTDEADNNRPIVEIAEERGFDMSLPFVSAAKAEELKSNYVRNKWGSLVISMMAFLSVFFVVYRYFGNWLTALFCAFFGPYFFMSDDFKNPTFSLGGDALDHAEEQGQTIRPDWIAIFMQFIFGAVAGVFVSLGIYYTLIPDYSNRSLMNLPYFLFGGALILGGVFMIHGDKLFCQSRVFQAQGMEHNRFSLNLCRIIIFAGVGISIYSFIL